MCPESGGKRVSYLQPGDAQSGEPAGPKAEEEAEGHMPGLSKYKRPKLSPSLGRQIRVFRATGVEKMSNKTEQRGP